MQETLLALTVGVLELQVDELVGFEERGFGVEYSVDWTGDASVFLLAKVLNAAGAKGVAAVGKQQWGSFAQVEFQAADLTVHYILNLKFLIN